MSSENFDGLYNQDCGPLFKCSVAKHLKECKNGCSLSGKVCFYLIRVMFRFDDTVWEKPSDSFDDSEESELQGTTRDDFGGNYCFARP